MKITVIGCGRWGTFITWYLDRLGHEVTLYGRASSKHMNELIKTRKNNLTTLSDKVKFSTDISCVLDCEVLIISINSQGLGSLCDELNELQMRDKIVVLCMKGIDIESEKTLSQVASQRLLSGNSVAVWLGPGHVQEFCAGIPNCMVIDSASDEVKQHIIDNFSGDLIRFYYGEDLLGNEIGAAAKNVIGIAAGMLDGLGLGALKGALMSRGAREIARLISAMGGNELSAYGLCHLGDYEATVFSPFSHNRIFGELFIKGESYEELAEGYHTVRALVRLGDEYGTELPICETVYKVLYENKDGKEALDKLFTRSLKNEMY